MYPEFQIHLSREQGVSIKFRIPVLNVVCATTIIVSEVSLKIRTTFNMITAVIHCRRGLRFSLLYRTEFTFQSDLYGAIDHHFTDLSASTPWRHPNVYIYLTPESGHCTVVGIVFVDHDEVF